MDLYQQADLLYGREDCRSSLKKFCRDYLGYENMNPIHDELCDLLQTDPHKFKLILMPRYTFKSSICTIGYSLWKLIKNPDERILIYSDANTKAIAFLNGIKSHITGKVAKSKFRRYYFKWETDPKNGKWNEDQILVSSRTTAYPEPSVDTGGIETSKVGLHYDVIIFDDIVSDKNITTKAQMDKVIECYKKALSLLRPGGEVLIVGTRWHFGDLYGRLIAENEEKKTFKIYIKKAIEDGEYKFDDIGDNSLTPEFLTQQRAQQGSFNFSCLYMNEPVDDETAVFKGQNFSFYGGIKNDDLYITGTLDPAGETSTGDFNAITVVGTDNQMNMHILEVVNKHMSPSEIIQTIINLNYKYKFKIFGIETNFFRGMLRAELERKRTEEHADSPENFPLFGIHEFQASSKRGEGKQNRIMALQPYHERGALKFPGKSLALLEGGFAELADQMLKFPAAPHDDALDSLAYHLPLIRKGGVVKKKELPRNSPAWLERKAYDAEIGSNHRLPRRYRRWIPEPSLS